MPRGFRQLRPHNSFVFAFLVVFCSLSVVQSSETSLGSSVAFRSAETPHLLFGEQCCAQRVSSDPKNTALASVAVFRNASKSSSSVGLVRGNFCRQTFGDSRGGEEEGSWCPKRPPLGETTTGVPGCQEPLGLFASLDYPGSDPSLPLLCHEFWIFLSHLQGRLHMCLGPPGGTVSASGAAGEA